MNEPEWTPELRRLAEDAPRWRRWRWASGMLTLPLDDDARTWRLVEKKSADNTWHLYQETGPRIRRVTPNLAWLAPDLLDPGTVGCLFHRVVSGPEPDKIRGVWHDAVHSSMPAGTSPWVAYCLAVARAAQKLLG